MKTIMTKPNTILMVGLCLLLLSQPVAAVEDSGFKFENPYIQGSGGFSSGNAVGKFSAGFDAYTHYGIEAGSVGFTDLFATNFTVTYLSIVGKYPLNDKVILAGKVGALKWVRTGDLAFGGTGPGSDGINMLLGAELQYHAFKNVGFIFGAEYYGVADAAPCDTVCGTDAESSKTLMPFTLGIRITFR